MAEKETAYVKTVSAHEASNTLENLGNLLFLTAHHADDGIMVRKFITEAQSCVTKLAQFIRPELLSAKRSRSTTQSNRISSRA
jgi:hypothetical protein